MNVFHKVTLQTLKKNRVRTWITIIGVLLSTAMVCAVTTIVASFQGYYRDIEVYASGDWYGRVEGASPALRQQLDQDRRIAHVASAQVLGYAQSESQNEDKPYIYLLGADETFFQTMPVHYTGRLPAAEGEILVPTHYLQQGNGGATVALGDQLTLGLGDRTIDGESLTQSNPYTDGEVFTASREKTYTVVGFYERPDFEDYSAPGYTFLTVPEAGGPQTYLLYYKTTTPAKLAEVIAGYHLPEDENWGLLAAEGVFQYDNFGRVFFRLAAMLIFLIVLGSVSLIYSAFSISVSQRTQQFGLLRSVGATKKQLRRSIFYEAAVISAIGIPLGIVCGLGGIGVTLYFIGDMFRSLANGEIPMQMRVSWVSVGAAVGIAIVTVAISVWIPAKRATKVTALEAIRQSKDIRQSGREVRVSKLTWKLFGLEGALAKKYFRRNRRRYRATVVSLVLSLVLFISTNAFCLYLTQSVDRTAGVSNYDVYCNLEGADPEALYPELLQAKGVTGGIYFCEAWQTILVTKDQLDSSFLQFARQDNGYFDLAEALQDDSFTDPLAINIWVYYIADESYRDFLTAQGLDPEPYLENPVPAVYNQGTGVLYQPTADGGLDRQTYVYQLLADGVDTLVLRGGTGNWRYTAEGEPVLDQATDYFYGESSGGDLYLPVKTQTIALGQEVTSLPMGIDEPEGAACYLLYPYSAAPEEVRAQTAFYCTSADHRATTQALETIMLEHGAYTGAGQVVDVRESESSQRNLVTIINTFSYGFIVLISLIAVANVFNTMSTNVALRRREFAMLRSVGMTRGGINRMMNYECLLYGL
ncbi:MAG TPA: ABC transporter permease, partial [Candidatus Faecousia faecigallinarum]|nr:ABC transporter permease [Candidatus Faecousia faecigallinarum]